MPIEIVAFVDEFGDLNSDPWELGGIVVMRTEKPNTYMVGFLQPFPGKEEEKIIGSHASVAKRLAKRFNLEFYAAGNYNLKQQPGSQLKWQAESCVKEFGYSTRDQVPPELSEFLLGQIREMTQNRPNIDM